MHISRGIGARGFSNIFLILLFLSFFGFMSRVEAFANVDFLSHVGYVDSSGFYHIVGEVQNIGDISVSLVKINATFYDLSNAPITSKFTYTMIDVLLIGRKAPFEIILFDKVQSAQVHHYDLSMTFNAYLAGKPLGLQILWNSSNVDVAGWMHVVGEIKNAGTQKATSVKIVVTYYDLTSNVVAATSSWVSQDPPDINPGGTALFDVVLSKDRVPYVASYTLTAQSMEYALIEPVKLFVTDWSPGTCVVERGKIVGSSLSVSFKNGGNDRMYNAAISAVDSGGLELNPQSQNLGVVYAGGTKSTSFLVTAPHTVALGTYVVTFNITYNDFAGTPYSEIKMAQVDVRKLSTNITLSLEPPSVKIGELFTVTAKLIDGNGVPITGQMIYFYVESSQIGSTPTDASGNAVKNHTANMNAGTYNVKVFYNGSENHSSSNASSILVVNLIATTLIINVPSATEGKPVTITATLRDERGDPLPNATVQFYLAEEGTWILIDSATTNSTGVASIVYTPVRPGTFQVKAVFIGSMNYSESSSTLTALIVASISVDYTPYVIGVVIIIAAGGAIFLRVIKKKRKTISS